jgi:hypothetical protein
MMNLQYQFRRIVLIVLAIFNIKDPVADAESNAGLRIKYGSV